MDSTIKFDSLLIFKVHIYNNQPTEIKMNYICELMISHEHLYKVTIM